MISRLLLAVSVSWLAGESAAAKVTCPVGFEHTPGSGVTCVQRDCLEVGGAYDRALACTCGENKICKAPMRYTARERARCKDCPADRVVACVPRSQPCPDERKVACTQDNDCSGCTFCKEGQCAQAAAVIVTTRSTAEGGRYRTVGWGRSRVAFWPHKTWAARWLWMQGCKLRFRDIEDQEMLAELLAAEDVRALAYFGHCTETSLRKAPPAKRSSGSIFGARQEEGKTEPLYLPTMEGMTAAELRDDVADAITNQLAETLRRKGTSRAAARKTAKDAAIQRTQNGWLHYLVNTSCHSLDDSMVNTLLRPGGVYWGRKGTRHLGLDLQPLAKPK